MNWNQRHIENLKKEGKIRGFNIQKRKNYSKDQVQAIPREKPKGLIWLEWNLLYWANERSLEMRYSGHEKGELRFCQERKWRFDFAFPAIKVAVEYNGGMFMERSGHNSVRGLLRDAEKGNMALVLGWKVITLTPLNYTTVLKTLNEIVK